MALHVLLPIHILAGSLAIVFGVAALVSAKGKTLHRQSGMLFVYAMLAMGISASILSMKDGPDGNTIAAFLTAYFVLTSLMTVRPPTATTRRITGAAMVIALVLGLLLIGQGVTAAMRPRLMLNGVPAPMFFFLGGTLIGGAYGDWKVLRSGALRGAPRLARHLWRMCFAMFIAVGSFFSIRARVEKVLPWPFTTPAARVAIILSVFVAMLYWLWRVRRRRAPAIP